MTVPSSKQSVTYRPFLVKEQKSLLIALESQNRRDIVRSIIRTIESCVEEKLDHGLTTFDVDYMFTKIRSKSVGETSKINVSCSECNEENEISISLDDIEVTTGSEKSGTIIPITDDVSVKMKYPTYDEFLLNENLSESSTVTEALMQLIITCMDSIMTEEENISVKDETNEDIMSFLESMTSSQFEKISDFANNIPSLTKNIEFKCHSCGTENDHILRGLDDFF
jgi:hypothetical protein